MGIFFRKSFKVGPLRLNLSKSGLGVSAGVKGARLALGARGPYVAGGKDGVYFRKNLGTSKNATEGEQINNAAAMVTGAAIAIVGIAFIVIIVLVFWFVFSK